MDPTERRRWSDLPPDVLSAIGKRLETPMDVVRFRGVCSSFRSSIPPLRREASRFRFRIPHSPRSALLLRASTVYALETPDGAASGHARWLLKLEESEHGNMRILSLFSQRRIAYLPRKFPKVFDSLQFRIVEICRQYTLDYGDRTGGLVQGIQKVVMHPDSLWSDLDKRSVYFIDEGGQLGYWKHGDENWSHLDDPQGRGYDDIVVYEGEVCVVDQLGSVWQIDPSIGLRRFSLPIYGGDRHRRSDRWKHLVVSSGDLYVVDRYISNGTETWNFGVYKLLQQRRRWEEERVWEAVRSLGNSAFFLCKLGSFAVSAHELGGCDRNRIYYADKAYSCFSGEDVKVFSLADRSTEWLQHQVAGASSGWTLLTS